MVVVGVCPGVADWAIFFSSVSRLATLTRVSGTPSFLCIERMRGHVHNRAPNGGAGSDDEKRMLWSSWPDAIPSVHLQLSSLIPPPVASPDFPDVDWKRQEGRLVPFQVLQWMRYYQGICYTW